ncbi:hypothetical protein ACFX2J_045749 [Malus domestica]
MDSCAKYSKAAKETANTMVDSKLFALNGSNISAPTSLQLETVRQKIVDLKTRVDAIQVKHESAENEIGCYIPQIQDLEFTVSELRFAAYAKDEKVIVAYNQKEVDELQSIHVSLLEEDEQPKDEKAGLGVSRPSLFLQKTCLILLLRLLLVK